MNKMLTEILMVLMKYSIIALESPVGGGRKEKKIRLELKTKTLEEEWQIVRWVTKFLEDNEK